MRKKSCQKNWPQFPESHQGLQINFCKSPSCQAFGLAPESKVIVENNESQQVNDDHIQDQAKKTHPVYKTSGTGKNEASIVCKLCSARKANGEPVQVSFMMKSNQAVYEEYQRISAYLLPNELKCRNSECPTNVDGKPLKLKKRGFTKAGHQRYQCLTCGTSLTDSDGSRPHRRAEINLRLFDLLVSKVPLRKIAKLLHISQKTIYDKIDFIHKQCMKFVAERELRLLEGKLKLNRLYLSTDRQVQITNWVKRNDKRNTELYGIGTACLRTGYVFAFNFNFDHHELQEDVEAYAHFVGDTERPKHHRDTARVWLEEEFEAVAIRSIKAPVVAAMDLIDAAAQKAKIDETYNENLASEDFDSSTRLPAKGVLVHNEYTMLGHFLHLKRLFRHVGKTRFYMDQDAGMKNAYLSIFHDEIKAGNSDGFLVRSEKGFTVDDKRRALAETNALIRRLTGVPRKHLSSRDFIRVVTELVGEALNNMIRIGNSPELWLRYPIATMPEPEKVVAAITDISRYELQHKAHLYRKASLHAIDRFFMVARRDVNLLERPFHSATNQSRVWNGYSPYDPAMLTKLGDIYRVYYNYVNINDKRETPAMRIGLANGPVSSDKIIYYGKYE